MKEYPRLYTKLCAGGKGQVKKDSKLLCGMSEDHEQKVSNALASLVEGEYCPFVPCWVKQWNRDAVKTFSSRNRLMHHFCEIP